MWPSRSTEQWQQCRVMESLISGEVDLELGVLRSIVVCILELDADHVQHTNVLMTIAMQWWWPMPLQHPSSSPVESTPALSGHYWTAATSYWRLHSPYQTDLWELHATPKGFYPLHPLFLNTLKIHVPKGVFLQNQSKYTTNMQYTSKFSVSPNLVSLQYLWAFCSSARCRGLRIPM